MRRAWMLALIGCGYPPLGAAPPDAPPAGDAGADAAPFQTVAPVKISGAMSCTTEKANTARKIAVGGDGALYAVMTCGTAAAIAVSTDRGQSFAAPIDLSAALPGAPVMVKQVTVAAGPDGVAHVAMMLDSRAVYLRTTSDHGASWGAAKEVGTSSNNSAGLSLHASHDDVYVGFATAGGVAVARNHARGDGTFDLTQVAMPLMYFDLLYDPATGALVVGSDTPELHLRTSQDGGASFAPQVDPPAMQYHSDWAFGGGRIFVAGTREGTSGSPMQLCIIPTAVPSMPSAVAGLPNVATPQARSIAADAAGNAFIASQLDDGGVQLDRLAIGAPSLDMPRIINPMGGSPVVTALPDNQGAALVFTIGTAVWSTVQIY